MIGTLRTVKIFPHLYRCGHIEALASLMFPSAFSPKFPHLYRCGHIEARNLNANMNSSCRKFPHLYRCGHIEAETGSVLETTHINDFRIFIDAATLKHRKRLSCLIEPGIFPHLYRCGHIEASNCDSQNSHKFAFPHLYRCGHIEAYYLSNFVVLIENYFRIFIDAATLKLARPTDILVRAT